MRLDQASDCERARIFQRRLGVRDGFRQVARGRVGKRQILQRRGLDHSELELPRERDGFACRRLSARDVGRVRPKQTEVSEANGTSAALVKAFEERHGPLRRRHRLIEKTQARFDNGLV